MNKVEHGIQEKEKQKTEEINKKCRFNKIIIAVFLLEGCQCVFHVKRYVCHIKGLGDVICIPAHSHVSHQRDFTSEESEIIHSSSIPPSNNKGRHREK